MTMNVNNCQTKFPYVAAEDYSRLNQVIKAIPNLQALKNFKVIQKYVELEDANVIVIRSNNQQNIHKAIKYGLWSTTSTNNNDKQKKVEELWKEYQMNKKETFFFFKVAKTYRFIGVARLVSGLKNDDFPYWVDYQSNKPIKYKKHFIIEWIFIKDILFNKFGDVRDKQGKQLWQSLDFAQIDWQYGKQMLQIYMKTYFKKSILEQFQFYDQNQKNIRHAIFFQLCQNNNKKLMPMNNFSNPNPNPTMIQPKNNTNVTNPNMPMINKYNVPMNMPINPMTMNMNPNMMQFKNQPPSTNTSVMPNIPSMPTMNNPTMPYMPINYKQMPNMQMPVFPNPSMPMGNFSMPNFNQQQETKQQVTPEN